MTDTPLVRAEQQLKKLQDKNASPEKIAKAQARVRRLRSIESIKAPLLRKADRVITAAVETKDKWKLERKKARDDERKARRLKLDRAKHEGGRELDKRVEFAPDSGNLEALTVNRRHDILETMLAQRLIDRAEKAAGDHFIELCQSAEMIGNRSGDTDRISGPGPRSGPGDAALFAKDQLEAIERHLGRTGFQLLVLALHKGRTIAQIAAASDLVAMDTKASKRSELYVGKRIRETLTDLSSMRTAVGAERKDQQKPLAWSAPDARSTVRADLWDKTTPAHARKIA